MLPKSARPKLTLLHIEGSQDDRQSLHQAVQSTNSNFRLYGSKDLESALLHFIQYSLPGKKNPYPYPQLILLGFNVGIHAAPDFLYWLRILNGITRIPVIIYTPSFTPEQVTECYAGGATHFLRQPTEFGRMLVIVHVLDICMSRRQPRLEWLERLPEYQRCPEKPNWSNHNEPTPFSAPLNFVESLYSNQ